jgi:rfaE bifunctional protein nucleotidyltransferase chain/domain
MASHNYKDKIVSPGEALAIRERLRASGRKIVFTNGCFDLLHPGHLAYLREARDLGDFLIVGLNSDASVKRLKGPLRPVRDERERAVMLAALLMVDAVVIFGEDTPLELIKALRPDFLVKGGDWAPENIVGGAETIAAGGSVRSLSMMTGHSTTSLIERISRAYARKQ